MATHSAQRTLRLDSGVSTVRGVQQFRGNQAPSTSRVTLREYSEAWLADLIGRRPRTLEAYRSNLTHHVLPRLGDRPLAEITPDDVMVLSRELQELGYAPWSVNTFIRPLRTLFRHAARRGVVPASPFSKLERAELPRPWSPEQRVLNSEEIGRLLGAAPVRYALLLETALFTGLRQSELLGLRWENIDDGAGLVHVRRALDRNGQLVPTKTHSARRDVILVASLGSKLAAAKARSQYSDPSDYVFTSNRGTPMHWRNVSRRGLTPALATAGLGRVRWHDLRHTFASMLIASGANVLFVSQQLGHCAPDVTLTLYGHLWEEAEQADRARKALQTLYGRLSPASATCA